MDFCPDLMARHQEGYLYIQVDRINILTVMALVMTL